MLRYSRHNVVHSHQMAAIPLLLRSRLSNDSCIRHLALSNLALLGHVEPPKGRGIRILSLDGGGTRGLVTIQVSATYWALGVLERGGVNNEATQQANNCTKHPHLPMF